MTRMASGTCKRSWFNNYQKFPIGKPSLPQNWRWKY